jgi:hypothetical protein
MNRKALAMMTSRLIRNGTVGTANCINIASGIKSQRAPIVVLSLQRPRSRPLNSSGKRINEEVLSRTIELHLPDQLGAGSEGVPSETVNLLIALTILMSHDQLQVIARPGDMEIDKQSIPLCQLQALLPVFDKGWVHAGVPHIATNVSFDCA